jgi:hypothetical protein
MSGCSRLVWGGAVHGSQGLLDTFPPYSLDDDGCPARTTHLLHKKGVLWPLNQSNQSTCSP